MTCVAGSGMPPAVCVAFGLTAKGEAASAFTPAGAGGGAAGDASTFFVTPNGGSTGGRIGDTGSIGGMASLGFGTFTRMAAGWIGAGLEATTVGEAAAKSFTDSARLPAASHVWI